MMSRRLAAGALALALALTGAGCGDDNDNDSGAQSAAESDPFELYLTLAPADAPPLTRDEALARAVLGCGTDWPAGTTDRALADAYADVCGR